jgi:hypothetical protein
MQIQMIFVANYFVKQPLYMPVKEIEEKNQGGIWGNIL